MATRGKLVREVDDVPLDAAYVKFGENFDDGHYFVPSLRLRSQIYGSVHIWARKMLSAICFFIRFTQLEE